MHMRPTVIGSVVHGMHKLNCATHGCREPCVAQLSMFIPCVMNQSQGNRRLFGKVGFKGWENTSDLISRTSGMHVRTRIAAVLTYDLMLLDPPPKSDFPNSAMATGIAHMRSWLMAAHSSSG